MSFGKKISELELASELYGSDLIPIVQDGDNKAITGDALTSTLAESFATNEDIENVQEQIDGLDHKVEDNYNDLSVKIVEGDSTVTNNLTGALNDQYESLNDQINDLEEKHDQDLFNVNNSVQEWIDEIANKSSIDDLLNTLVRLSNVESLVTALADLVSSGGTGVVPGFHTQSTATIYPLTGYYRSGDNAVLLTTDTLNQALSKLETRVLQVEEATAGQGSYVITTGDPTLPTDGNIYSALRSRYEFLKAREMDIAYEQINFLNGVQMSNSFSSGFTGVGGKWFQEGSKWTLETDNLLVRGRAVFNELNINEIKALGGEILVTLADMIITEVEELADGSGWRCYFDDVDGTKLNKFRVLDQAICQKFEGTNVKRYWRLVMDVGTNWVDLSRYDCESGSDEPEIEDNLVQYGHRTEVDRQNAILISAQGTDGPSIRFYAQINQYSLVDKERTVIGKNSKFIGTLTQISGDGNEYLVPADKGEFVVGNSYYYYDRVSYDGSLWLCVATQTTEAPDETKPYIWQLQVRKGEQGQSGNDGAKWVEILGDRLFLYDNPDFTGTPTPSTISQEALVYNIDNPSYSWTNVESGIVISTFQHVEVTPAMFGTSRTLRLRCTVTDTDTGELFYDETQLAKLGDGASGEDAYYIDISNPSISIPFSSDGLTPSIPYGDVESYVYAYFGTQQVNVDDIQVTLLNGTGQISASVIVENGYYIGKITVQSLLSVSAQFRLDIKVNSQSQVFPKTMYLFQVRDGEDGFNGTDAASVKIIGDQIFHVYDNFDIDPQFIPLSATTYNMTNPQLQWSWTVAGQEQWTDIPGENNNGYTVSAYFEGFVLGHDSITFRITATENGTEYFDAITLSKIYDGQDGQDVYKGILSNEAHTVAANFKGEVASSELSQAHTEYELWKGLTKLTYGTDYNLVIIQQVPTNTSTIVNDTVNNILRITSLDNNFDTTVFKVQFTIPNPDGSGTTLIVDNVDFTITKAKGGAPGDYEVAIYGFSTTTPARPTFLTIPSAAGASGPDGTVWYTSIPSGAPIWMTKATFSGATDLPIIDNGYYWSAPTKITGDTGASGANATSDVIIYSRNATKPTRPTFATMINGSGTGPDGVVWYDSAIPAPGVGFFVWASKGRMQYDRNMTPIDGANYWTDPSQWNGYDGYGIDGKALNYRGDYDGSKVYYVTTYSRDVVKYNNNYYVRSGDTPSISGQLPTNTNFWAIFGASFESIATGLLFAEEATIAGWVFNNNYIHSVNNNVFLDGRSYSATTGAGTYPLAIGANAATAPSTAPFSVDRNGALVATNATITGTITASSGTFTGNVNARTLQVGNPVQAYLGAGGLIFSANNGIYCTTTNGNINIASYNPLIQINLASASATLVTGINISITGGGANRGISINSNSSSVSNYAIYSSGNHTFKQPSSSYLWDSPGALWSGTVNVVYNTSITPTITKAWGVSGLTVSPGSNATGSSAQFIVQHNLGHSEYRVIASINSPGDTRTTPVGVYIVSMTSSAITFRVWATNSVSGSTISTSFVMIGRNKTS